MRKYFLSVIWTTGFLLSLCALAQNIDSLQSVLVAAKEDTAKVILLNRTAEAVISNKPDKALQWVNESYALAQKLNFQNGIAGALKLKGDYYKLKGDFNAAIENYTLSKKIFENENDRRGSAMNGNLIASCFFEMGNFEESKKILKEVLIVGETLGDKKIIAGAFMRIANAWREEGDFQKSLELSFKAARLFEEINDQKGLASIYNNIASDFKDLKDYNNALKYHLLAFDIKKKSGDKKSMAYTYSNMGNLYRNMNDYEKALEYLNLSLSIRKELGDKKGISQDLQNIGIVFRNQKKYDAALNQYMQSLKLKKEIDDKKGEAIIYFNMAQLFVDEEKINDALNYLDKSEKLATEVNTKDLLADVFSLRSHALEKLHEEKSALENLKKAVAINDSLMNKEKSKQIIELQTKYETQKKDKELTENKLVLANNKAELERKSFLNYIFGGGIVALAIILFFAVGFFRQKQKFEKQKTEEQIRTSIAGDLHDDVGATLSSINIYTRLAKEKLGGDLGQVKALLEKINNSSQEMMNNMSDMVWAIKPDNDAAENLSLKIKSFAREILSPKEINYKIESNEDESYKISMVARRNLFLVAKEAINNIAKYSEAKNVLITIVRENGQLHLVIADDGIGFSSKPAAGERGGTGISNMKQRTEQLHGKFYVESGNGTGTKIKSVFDLDKINY